MPETDSNVLCLDSTRVGRDIELESVYNYLVQVSCACEDELASAVIMTVASILSEKGHRYVD